MKDNFREKLQAIYGEPPEELENLIHWQILSLPDSVQMQLLTVP